MCLYDHNMVHGEGPGHFTKGNVYKIKSISRDTIFVEKDNQGSTTNGWFRNAFRPIGKNEFTTLQLILFGVE